MTEPIDNNLKVAQNTGIVVSEKHTSIFEKIIVPLLVGVIAVVGTLAGVQISNKQAAKIFLVQKNIELQTLVLHERISLVSRAAAIFGKAPGIVDLWDKYLSDMKYVPNKGIRVPTDISVKLADYKGEYESVMFLASIYFGPKTNEAIKELSDEKVAWWNKSRDKIDKFMVAMMQELSYGIAEQENTNIPKIK